MNVGAVSVVVNNQQAVKVNIHSSGAVIGSFLNAIIDIDIPNGAQLYIGLDSSDVAINIDNIIALGRKPESKLKGFGYHYGYIRHPANGGKNKFVNGLKEVLK